jgi:hypothetical protein
MSTESDRAQELYDDFDFAGVLQQHFHQTGDESVPWGPSIWLPKEWNRDLVELLLKRESSKFRLTPLYRRSESQVIAALVSKLRELEAHHVEQNRLKGRAESRSKTLRIVRDALREAGEAVEG